MIKSNGQQYDFANKFLFGEKEALENFVEYYNNPNEMFSKSEQDELDEIDLNTLISYKKFLDSK